MRLILVVFAAVGIVLGFASSVLAAPTIKARHFEYPGLGNGGLDGIALGADGNMWASDTKGGIGRFTARGGVRIFRSAVVNAGSSNVTLGGDGAIWYTAPSSSTVGRVDARGKVTPIRFEERCRPRLGGLADDCHAVSPVGVTTDAAGDVWTASGGAGPEVLTRIDRDDAAVSETYLGDKLGFSGSLTGHIARGPGGSVWFGAYKDDAGYQAVVIGRIMGDGTITYSPASKLSNDRSVEVGIRDMIRGRDGNLWSSLDITDLGEDGDRIETSRRYRIARMMPSGSLHEYAIRKDLAAGDLAWGPDGAIWFVAGGDKIGRLSMRGKVRVFRKRHARKESTLNQIAFDRRRRLWFTEDWSTRRFARGDGGAVGFLKRNLSR